MIDKEQPLEQHCIDLELNVYDDNELTQISDQFYKINQETTSNLLLMTFDTTLDNQNFYYSHLT